MRQLVNPASFHHPTESRAGLSDTGPIAQLLSQEEKIAFRFELMHRRSAEALKHPSMQDEPLYERVRRLQEQMQVLMEDMEYIKEGMRMVMQKLEDDDAGEDAPNNYDMTASQIRDLILDKVGLDKPFYPSDLAMDYGLDFDAVLEAVDVLRREGRIVDRD